MRTSRTWRKRSFLSYGPEPTAEWPWTNASETHYRCARVASHVKKNPTPGCEASSSSSVLGVRGHSLIGSEACLQLVDRGNPAIRISSDSPTDRLGRGGEGLGALRRGGAARPWQRRVRLCREASAPGANRRAPPGCRPASAPRSSPPARRSCAPRSAPASATRRRGSSTAAPPACRSRCTRWLASSAMEPALPLASVGTSGMKPSSSRLLEMSRTSRTPAELSAETSAPLITSMRGACSKRSPPLPSPPARLETPSPRAPSQRSWGGEAGGGAHPRSVRRPSPTGDLLAWLRPPQPPAAATDARAWALWTYFFVPAVHVTTAMGLGCLGL